MVLFSRSRLTGYGLLWLVFRTLPTMSGKGDAAGKSKASPKPSDPREVLPPSAAAGGGRGEADSLFLKLEAMLDSKL
jgi:hypothetical protein